MIQKDIKLRDVARKAGVSLATASSILTGQAGKRRVAMSTQRKVLDAAKQLEYIHWARPPKGMINLPVRSILIPFMEFLLDSSFRIQPEDQEQFWDCDKQQWASINHVIDIYGQYKKHGSLDAGAGSATQSVAKM